MGRILLAVLLSVLCMGTEAYAPVDQHQPVTPEQDAIKGQGVALAYVRLGPAPGEECLLKRLYALSGRLERFTETWEPDFGAVYAKRPEPILEKLVEKALTWLQEVREEHKILVVLGFSYKLPAFPAHLTACVSRQSGGLCYQSLMSDELRLAPSQVVVKISEQETVRATLDDGLTPADVVEILVKKCCDSQINVDGLEKSFTNRQAHYRTSKYQLN